jgi:hypothetical protein
VCCGEEEGGKGELGFKSVHTICMNENITLTP